MKNIHPIHLAYLQYGSGHYDAVVPESQRTTPISISTPVAMLHAVAVDRKERKESHVHSLWLTIVHATTANNLAHKTANARDVLIPTELSHHFNLLHWDNNERDSVIEVKLYL